MPNAYLRLMRLHQPTGIWLLMWPCWWSAALASSGLPSLKILALFALGAVVMRAAGCIINDIWDREIDAQVERTKTRPLASGEITVPQALAVLAGLLLSGLWVALELGVFWWAAASLPLIVIYPLMKRITWWPQLFLGMTFNWGALLGWVAVRSALEAPALLLYAAGIFWTLGYDTLYAHQDKADDMRLGVKSTALHFGSATKLWVGGFYNLTLIFLLAAGGLAQTDWMFYLFIIIMMLHLKWQVRSVRLDEPVSCRHIFISNQYAGALPFIGVLMAHMA